MRIKSKLGDYNINFWDDIKSMITHTSRSSDLVWIIDQNVYSSYSNVFKNIPVCEPITHLVCNEELKSFEYINLIIDHFARMKVKPLTTVIVVGGGTLQDAASFVCSIYNRGVKWIFIPTTLLSMVDSCIGGKTSINYRNKKNILGTFYPPSEILICEKFLHTLPKEYMNSGMGEIIKFYILQNGIHLITSNEFDLSSQIRYSLEYKASIIENDEFDKGERKFLNYGHTFGHALESTSKYQIVHGIAIMIGILIVNRYALKLGFITKEKEQEIIKIIKPLIPYKTYDLDWFNYDSLIEIIKSDKKNTSTINLVILKNNSPTLHSVLDFVPLQESLKEIREEIFNHNL